MKQKHYHQYIPAKQTNKQKKQETKKKKRKERKIAFLEMNNVRLTAPVNIT